jgi:predicted acetyltransferase
MQIEIFDARVEDEPVLANLMQLYLHDFTDWTDWDVDSDGRYPTWDLHGCWTNPARHPFFIVVDGHIAGFAIVDRGSHETNDPDVWDMAEFFVMRKYRRSAVGRVVAHRLFQRYPGRWEVRIMQGNERDLAFWRRIINECAPDVTESPRARGGHMESFTSVPRAAD